MRIRPDLKFLGIVRNTGHYFNFLFTRGFRMVSVIFTDARYENWQVTLMSDECVVKIFSHHGKVDLALSTLQLCDAVGFFALDDLIFYVNGNRDLHDPMGRSPANEMQRFEQLAWRLEKHVDRILDEIRSLPILPARDHPSVRSNDAHSLSYRN